MLLFPLFQKHFPGTVPNAEEKNAYRNDYWKNHSLTRCTFVDKVMSLFFNMLSGWS